MTLKHSAGRIEVCRQDEQTIIVVETKGDPFPRSLVVPEKFVDQLIKSLKQTRRR